VPLNTNNIQQEKTKIQHIQQTICDVLIKTQKSFQYFSKSTNTIVPKHKQKTKTNTTKKQKETKDK
jgi:hypothetical protein